MRKLLKDKLSQYKLATMFSIIIFANAIFVSTIVQTIKYNESKTTLESNLKAQAEYILDFSETLIETLNEKFLNSENPKIALIVEKEVFEKFTKKSEGKIFFEDFHLNKSNNPNQYIKDEISFFKKNLTITQHEIQIYKNQTKYYLLSRPLKKDQQIIRIKSVLIDMNDFNDALNSSLWLAAFLWIINVGILLIWIHVLFIKLISKRIQKILEIIFQVEKGNFVINDLMKGENIKHGSSHNEIDRVFRHLYKMVNGLKPVIDNVVGESKNVVFESLYCFSKIKDTLELSQEQRKRVSNSNKSIDKILDVNQSLGENLNKLFETSQNSLNTISEGQVIVQNNLDSSSLASNAMDNTVNTILELKKYSNEISGTIQKITDIANETNLISLNAAIEASHAGEYGKGFAVVADKIRDLADISIENSQAINSVLQSIHKNVEEVMSSADNTKNIIDQLNSDSIVLQKSFSSIDSVIHQNNSVLESFQVEFTNEKRVLDEIMLSLKRVEDGNQRLDKNSRTVESSVNTITKISSLLKNLSNGFDIMYNKRKSVREVVIPPVEGTIEFKNDTLRALLYDISKEGISFIITEKYKEVKIKNGEKGTITFDREINGKKTFNFTTMHILEKKTNGTRLLGATI